MHDKKDLILTKKENSALLASCSKPDESHTDKDED